MPSANSEIDIAAISRRNSRNRKGASTRQPPGVLTGVTSQGVLMASMLPDGTGFSPTNFGSEQVVECGEPPPGQFVGDPLVYRHALLGGFDGQPLVQLR